MSARSTVDVQPAVRGHVFALLTVLVWAVTFVSTKVLLVHLTPIEILFFRFIIGFVALALLRPRRLHLSGFAQEKWFIFAGITGVTLYYLLENIALTFTTASIVGVVVAAAPLFTGLISAIALKERLRAPFFVGFVVAMAGVCLVSFAGGVAASGGVEGTAEIIGGLGEAGLLGVGLALAAAATWAVYSVVTKKISTFGYDSILVTRRTFAWGLLFMVPTLPFLGFSPDWASLAAPEMWGNLVFLGLGASALCFVTWNLAVKELGPVKTSLYIYLVPALTVLASAAILGDPLTPPVIIGVLLTIGGLLLSERGK
ncbi:DMT family transporter [Eggerthella sp. YY7918]|uniref:DMT family transporter n=1 Tax=Eggerthella sp. (strain YY7918) TaxID=502558 RepID=UPI000217193A|nr:DMT family transporter [Eggerthella sp. YY7918]BAK44639.1 permease of the drug [Eggerthella sp. YY7918]